MTPKHLDFIIIFIVGLIIPTIILLPEINNIKQKHTKEILELNKKLSYHEVEAHKYKFENKLIKDILYKYIISNVWDVQISAYTTRKQETNNDNNNTAIMEKPVPGWSIAVSQDLNFLLGKKVYIPDYGVRYVNDLMNQRYTKSIDLLVKNVKTAKKIGRKHGQLILIEPFKF